MRIVKLFELSAALSLGFIVLFLIYAFIIYLCNNNYNSDLSYSIFAL